MDTVTGRVDEPTDSVALKVFVHANGLVATAVGAETVLAGQRLAGEVRGAPGAYLLGRRRADAGVEAGGILHAKHHAAIRRASEQLAAGHHAPAGLADHDLR